MTELGGELGREGHRDEGGIRLHDSAFPCMFVSLPLQRRQFSCSGTVPNMYKQCNRTLQHDDLLSQAQSFTSATT